MRRRYPVGYPTRSPGQSGVVAHGVVPWEASSAGLSWLEVASCALEGVQEVHEEKALEEVVPVEVPSGHQPGSGPDHALP